MDMAKLTWENEDFPRPGSGTLDDIVNQATHNLRHEISMGKRVMVDAQQYDFIPLSNSRERKAGEEESNRELNIEKSSRKRSAHKHKESERKRRTNITQKLKTLHKLGPNSSETTQECMLDASIKYLIQLETQVHLMTPTYMTVPALERQRISMSMMAMGRGPVEVMDMNTLNCVAAATVPTFNPMTAAYKQMPPPAMFNPSAAAYLQMPPPAMYYQPWPSNN